MNRQIVQLFGLFVLLFAVLVLFTSRWTVFEAESLADNPDNRRPLIEEQRIPRGLILASDGTVLARSRGRGRGQNRIYTRTYPTGPAFGHPVGFSYIRNGRRGLELSRNDDLTGDEDEFESILAGLESRDREGDDVVTNLDVAGTQAAVAGLAGRKGAVVAIEPQTGKVRVMVSIPEYDPNLIPSQIGAFNTNPDQPLLNRTTQELYPPGSTFKVVTAAAALDSGEFTPETTIDGSSPKKISGVPLENSGGHELRPDLAHRRAHELGEHGVRARWASGSGATRSWSTWSASASTRTRSSTTRTAQMIASGDPERRGRLRRRRLRRRARRDRAGRARGRDPRRAAPDGGGRRRGGERRPADEAAAHRPDRAQGRAREPSGSSPTSSPW